MKCQYEKKRERWSESQTKTLVYMWKEHFRDLRTLKQHLNWIKIKTAVNEKGPENRSSLPEVFRKKGVLPATLLKERPWHRCFPLNFVKFPKNIFSYRTPPMTASDKKPYRKNSNV